MHNVRFSYIIFFRVISFMFSSFWCFKLPQSIEQCRGNVRWYSGELYCRGIETTAPARLVSRSFRTEWWGPWVQKPLRITQRYLGDKSLWKPRQCVRSKVAIKKVENKEKFSFQEWWVENLAWILRVLGNLGNFKILF